MRVHEHHRPSHLVEIQIHLLEDCYSQYPDATVHSLALRQCPWSRRTTKSASEALLEVEANVLDACVGRAVLRATFMVPNIVTAESKNGNPEILIGLRMGLCIPSGMASLTELYNFECISTSCLHSLH